MSTWGRMAACSGERAAPPLSFVFGSQLTKHATPQRSTTLLGRLVEALTPDDSPFAGKPARIPVERDVLLMIEITDQTIETAAVLQQVASTQAGAVVLFLGTAREMTGDRRTASLEYECYGEMARKQLAELEAEARGRWPLVGCAIVHRIGHLELGEAAVAIAVSSPHRREAFEAGQWLIDTLKQVVPIWKKENWADGTSDWVHSDEGLRTKDEDAY